MASSQHNRTTPAANHDRYRKQMAVISERANVRECSCGSQPVISPPHSWYLKTDDLQVRLLNEIKQGEVEFGWEQDDCGTEEGASQRRLRRRVWTGLKSYEWRVRSVNSSTEQRETCCSYSGPRGTLGSAIISMSSSQYQLLCLLTVVHFQFAWLVVAQKALIHCVIAFWFLLIVHNQHDEEICS